MNIVVCIKQVPDTKGGVKFNPDGTLDRAAMLAIMNPDDKAGLEAALRIGVSNELDSSRAISPKGRLSNINSPSRQEISSFAFFVT